jgi:hypothetical protein
VALTDLVIPTASNTTGADLTATGTFKIKGSYLQATAVFTLPTLQGPYTVEVQTCNTGSSSDGLYRYCVVTDAAGAILAVGPLNPRGSNLSLLTTSYSYAGTDIKGLRVQAVQVADATVPTVGENVSAYSNVGLNYGVLKYTANPLADTKAPGEITGLSATGDNATSKVTLTWSPPTDTDFDHVVVTSTDGTTTSSAVSVPKGTNTWTTGTLANGTYTFTLKTVDTTGNASTGVASSAVTIVATDVTPPAEVTNLAVNYTTGDNKVTLTWTAPADTDFDHVVITDNDGTTTSSAVSVAGATTWTSGTLANGTYTFTVKTVDATGNTSTGATTASVVVALADTTPPAEVTALTVNAYSDAGTTASLTWTASTSTDVDHYLVSTDGGVTTTSVTGTATTLTGLTAGSTFTVTVQGVDTTGNKSAGTTASVTTVAAVSGANIDLLFNNETVVSKSTVDATSVAAAGSFTFGAGYTVAKGAPSGSGYASYFQTEGKTAASGTSSRYIKFTTTTTATVTVTAYLSAAQTTARNLGIGTTALLSDATTTKLLSLTTTSVVSATSVSLAAGTYYINADASVRILEVKING